MAPTPEEEAARAALRARQGKGARYDAPAAPQDDLLLARRGAAFFARKLGELPDAALTQASLRDGWSRRRLIAHVGCHARALAELIETVRTGAGAPARPYPRDADLRAGIDLAATLPARALRSLVHHATLHLDVEWRDLTDAQWETPLSGPGSIQITARDTPRLRACEIWQSAVDLGNGARRADIPRQLVGSGV